SVEDAGRERCHSDEGCERSRENFSAAGFWKVTSQECDIILTPSELARLRQMQFDLPHHYLVASRLWQERNYAEQCANWSVVVSRQCGELESGLELRLAEQRRDCRQGVRQIVRALDGLQRRKSCRNQPVPAALLYHISDERERADLLPWVLQPSCHRFGFSERRPGAWRSLRGDDERADFVNRIRQAGNIREEIVEFGR